MHEIITNSYSYIIPKKEIDEELHSIGANNSDTGSGLYGPVGFYDLGLPDLNAANAELKKRDGGYANLAISYYSNGKPTKKSKEMEEKILELKEEIYNLENGSYFVNHKSSFVACKDCGSKLNIKLLISREKNYCPLCGADLRPDTFHKSLKRKREKLSELVKKLPAKGTRKWLTKIEYHC